MDFEPTERSRELQERLTAFLHERIEPAEATFAAQVAASGDPHHDPPILETLKEEARERGLWNLFHPDPEWGAGLSNAEYAPLAEIMGRSHLAPEVCNCSAPDTGNMEVLSQFGTPEQQDQWLRPLLDGEIRSAFAMTEPDVASSDARNIALSIERNLPVFGYVDHEGHAEITFEDVRVPSTNLIAGEGDGFLIAQARLGPGRIHHCMRTIGAAERALELL